MKNNNNKGDENTAKFFIIAHIEADKWYLDCDCTTDNYYKKT